MLRNTFVNFQGRILTYIGSAGISHNIHLFWIRFKQFKTNIFNNWPPSPFSATYSAFFLTMSTSSYPTHWLPLYATGPIASGLGCITVHCSSSSSSSYSSESSSDAWRFFALGLRASQICKETSVWYYWVCNKCYFRKSWHYAQQLLASWDSCYKEWRSTKRQFFFFTSSAYKWPVLTKGLPIRIRFKH